MPTTAPMRSASLARPSSCALFHWLSWHSTQLTLTCVPGAWGMAVMFLWHSTHSRLPCTLLPNLSGMTCSGRGLPSAPGAAKPSLPWQPMQVSFSSTCAALSAAGQSAAPMPTAAQISQASSALGTPHPDPPAGNSARSRMIAAISGGRTCVCRRLGVMSNRTCGDAARLFSLAMAIKTIAVLTAGGDAPGVNAAVRAVVRTALALDLRAHGIRRAYEGLVHGDICDLGARDVGGIIQRGGTILKTSRFPDFARPEVQQQALRQLKARGVEALVAIGGDGTMRGALALHKLGFPVIGIPASIDNDVYGTDISIGVDTALNTIVEAIDKLPDTASSHQRAFIVETMGRKCGHLALMSGIISGAEMTLIPEQDVSPEEVAQAV